jgi:DNA-binding NtrC family response regulator
MFAVRPRILIVDNEPQVRRSLAEWLTSDAYDVHVVTDDSTGLQYLQRDGWSAVIADLKSRDVDALRLLEAVRTMDEAPAVVVVTRPEQIDAAIQAIKLGAAD